MARHAPAGGEVFLLGYLRVRYMEGRRAVRCPGCDSAVLNTPRIVVRRAKSTRIGLPLKACTRCRIIVAGGAMDGWKIWTPAGLAET